MRNNLEKKNRIWELDFIRGLCIVLMVFDHIMISIYYEFGKVWADTGNEFLINLYVTVKDYLKGDLTIYRAIIRPIVLWCFFSISGISSFFSRSNFKRGIQLLACAMLLTLGSYIFDPQEYLIRFGVLHMLSCCIIIWAIISKLAPNKVASACIALVVATSTYALHLAIPNMGIVVDNRSFWVIFSEDIAKNPYLFSPGDYFPLLPNISIFMIGVAFSPLLYPDRKSILPSLEGYWSKPMEFVGRHALFVMLVHTLVIAGLLALITYLFIDKGNWVLF